MHLEHPEEATMATSSPPESTPDVGSPEVLATMAAVTAGVLWLAWSYLKRLVVGDDLRQKAQDFEIAKLRGEIRQSERHRITCEEALRWVAKELEETKAEVAALRIELTQHKRATQ